MQGGRGTVGSGDPISTLSVATTNRPTMPQADASSYKRKNYLEYQLDTMHGMHVLGGLRFLSGLDKRLSGGARPSATCSHAQCAPQSLYNELCLASVAEQRPPLLPGCRPFSTHAARACRLPWAVACVVQLGTRR